MRDYLAGLPGLGSTTFQFLCLCKKHRGRHAFLICMARIYGHDPLHNPLFLMSQNKNVSIYHRYTICAYTFLSFAIACYQNKCCLTSRSWHPLAIFLLSPELTIMATPVGKKIGYCVTCDLLQCTLCHHPAITVRQSF